MATTKSRIREIISEHLEVNTTSLVDDEIRELSNDLAEKLAIQFDDVEDDEADGDTDERNDDSDSDE